MNMENQDTCLEDEIKLRKTDDELKAEIEEILKGDPVTALHSMKKRERNELLRQIKAIEGATQRQIARITGLNQSMVFKA